MYVHTYVHIITHEHTHTHESTRARTHIDMHTYRHTHTKAYHSPAISSELTKMCRVWRERLSLSVHEAAEVPVELLLAHRLRLYGYLHHCRPCQLQDQRGLVEAVCMAGVIERLVSWEIKKKKDGVGSEVGIWKI